MQNRLRLIALVAALTIIAAPAAHGQAQATALQTQMTKLAAQLRKMDSTVARLEARVAKLEASSEPDDKDMREEAEQGQSTKEIAALERRISALERSPSAKGGKESAAASRTVRAPFVVEDDGGGVILRVTGGKSPRLMIGQEKGGQVELGTGSAGGGIVRVRDAGNADRVILIASDGFGQLRALSQNHSAVLTSNDEKLGATLGLFVGDVPTARMRSGTTGYGAFLLTDPDGNEAVFAGSTQSEKCTPGILRTGPRRRAGTLGPPSTVVGAC